MSKYIIDKNIKTHFKIRKRYILNTSEIISEYNKMTKQVIKSKSIEKPATTIRKIKNDTIKIKYFRDETTENFIQLTKEIDTLNTRLDYCEKKITYLAKEKEDDAIKEENLRKHTSKCIILVLVTIFLFTIYKFLKDKPYEILVFTKENNLKLIKYAYSIFSTALANSVTVILATLLTIKITADKENTTLKFKISRYFNYIGIIFITFVISWGVTSAITFKP